MILEMENCGYSMEYYDVCQEIWQKYVPDSGNAEVVHGELLRLTEYLRMEAINNENRNWNDDCENACNFLWHHLINHTKEFEMTGKEKVREVITCIRERGEKKEIYANSVIFDYLEDRIAERYLNLHEKEEEQQKQLKEIKRKMTKSVLRGLFTGLRRL